MSKTEIGTMVKTLRTLADQLALSQEARAASYDAADFIEAVTNVVFSDSSADASRMVESLKQLYAQHAFG